jgi:Alanyl-tRNA synthetase
LEQKTQGMAGEIRDLRRRMEMMITERLQVDIDRFLISAVNIDGLKVVTTLVPEGNGERLKKMGDLMRGRDESIVAVMASVSDEKITFLAVCGKDAVKRGVRAGDLIKAVTEICGGSGGGRPESAMGGGKYPEKVDNALAVVDDIVKEKLRG